VAVFIFLEILSEFEDGCAGMDASQPSFLYFRPRGMPPRARLFF
jgi:hypothetical protein